MVKTLALILTLAGMISLVLGVFGIFGTHLVDLNPCHGPWQFLDSYFFQPALAYSENKTFIFWHGATRIQQIIAIPGFRNARYFP
jgi:hypothetical protein